MISRIRELIELKKLSVSAFEQSIGASDGMIRRAIKNGTDIQSKWLTNISDNYPDMSLDWLITGRGPMLRDGQPAEAPNPAAEPLDVGREATIYKELLAEQKADYEKKVAARDEKIEKLNRQLGAAEAKLGEREARGFRPEDLGGVRPADFPYTTSGKNPYHK